MIAVVDIIKIAGFCFFLGATIGAAIVAVITDKRK